MAPKIGMSTKQKIIIGGVCVCLALLGFLLWYFLAGPGKKKDNDTSLVIGPVSAPGKAPSPTSGPSGPSPTSGPSSFSGPGPSSFSGPGPSSVSRFRYVQINGIILNFNELEIFNTSGLDIVSKKAVTLIKGSQYATYLPGNITDGNKNTFCHTYWSGDESYEIDLGSDIELSQLKNIVITNRTDAGQAGQDRIKGVKVIFLDMNRRVLLETPVISIAPAVLRIDMTVSSPLWVGSAS